MKKILVTYAVKEEFILLNADNCNIIYTCTGIGETKSAFVLTKKIIEEKSDFVLNIGTAGTFLHNVGDIFVATYFIDRDYEAVKFPGVEYQIDGKLFIKNTPQLTNRLSEYQKVGICSTGDTFVTETISLSGGFVYMETYAQAYVCKEQSIPFLSVKYISGRSW